MSEVIISGAVGHIEGRYTNFTTPDAPIALVLHPHPLHGGTMNNTVVYNMYKTLALNGYNVLRINFRGVGLSMGKFDNGIGELLDAATALDWLQGKNPTSTERLVAGFSFGSWIAMQLIMRRPEITRFIAVSPPIKKYDFSFLSPCPISGLFLQGNKDSVVSEAEVNSFIGKLSKPQSISVDYRVIDDADHFFRNKISQFNEEINKYLLSCIKNPVKKNDHDMEEYHTSNSDNQAFL